MAKELVLLFEIFRVAFRICSAAHIPGREKGACYGVFSARLNRAGACNTTNTTRFHPEYTTFSFSPFFILMFVPLQFGSVRFPLISINDRLAQSRISLCLEGHRVMEEGRSMKTSVLTKEACSTPGKRLALTVMLRGVTSFSELVLMISLAKLSELSCARLRTVHEVQSWTLSSIYNLNLASRAFTFTHVRHAGHSN